MSGFLVDEDLPRSLVGALRAVGLTAEHVYDAGLRGCGDTKVLAHAVARDWALVTGDVGFGNIFLFPLGSHRGIFVARFPNELSVAALNAAIVSAVTGLLDAEINGSLIIVEPGRIRLRKASL